MIKDIDLPKYFRKINKALEKEGFLEVKLEKTVGGRSTTPNGKSLHIFPVSCFDLPNYSFCAELSGSNGKVIAKIPRLSDSYDSAVEQLNEMIKWYEATKIIS